MATIVAATGAAGNWTSGGAWVGGVAPTAADDAQITVLTTSITIDPGALCRSADFTGFTGTLTAGATSTLTIGDATAGLSSIALKMPSGFTYAPNAASTITFASTSATQQTVSINSGYTMGNLTFNSTSNGNYAFTANSTVATTATVNFTKGTLHTDGASDNSALTHNWGLFNASNSNTRTLTLGTSTFNMNGGSATVWNISTTTGLVFSGASSVINLIGSSFTFTGNQTYGTITGTPSSSFSCTFNAFTAAVFTYTGGNNKTQTLTLGGNITVTGTLTLTGNSSINRLLVGSTTLATQRTITNTSTVMTISNTDFSDIKMNTTWNASARTDIGDTGGNSGITFPASVQQTWSGTSGGNWSANAWTTRVPLPQDDVVINAAFSASQTVTADMPRLGRSIDWTGATGSGLTWSFGSVANSVYGSITRIAGVAISGTQTLTLAGRSSYTLTNAGITLTQAVTVSAPTGTYTLNDAINTNGVLAINTSFTSSSFNITASTMTRSGSLTQTITLGTSTITLTATSVTSIVNISSTTGLTFSGASSTIVISATSSSIRTFVGGGLTFGTLTYILAGSTGDLVITGSNTFDTINFSDASNARILTLTNGTTTTVSTFNVNGTSGKLMTLNSASSGVAATLSKSSGIVSCDFLSIKDSTASGGASFYAGANSTSVSGNSGWFFKAPPAATLTETVTHTDTFIKQTGRIMTELLNFSDYGGYGLSFDGGNSLVTLANTASLNITGNMTIEANIILSTLDANIREIFKKDGQYLIRLNNTLLEAALWTTSTGLIVIAEASAISLGRHHVAISWDGTTFRLLRDGAVVASSAMSGTISTGSNLATIGAQSGGGEYFQGIIDELRVSNSARYTGAYTMPSAPFVVDGNTNALWHFDDGSGTSLTDSSGNTNTGTLAGTPQPTWVQFGALNKLTSRPLSDTVTTTSSMLRTPGKVLTDILSLLGGGNSLRFDGISSRVDVGLANAIGSKTNNLTIMAWVKPDALVGIQRVFAAGRQLTNNGIAFGLNDAGLVFTSYTIQDYSSSTITLSNSQYVHIAAKLDSSNNVTFYVNGVNKETVTGSSPANANTDDHHYIGTSISPTSVIEQPFAGLIDEVRVYNTALTDQQVLDVYNSANTYLANLIGYWHMDEGAGTSTADRSASGYTGTLQGTSLPTWDIPYLFVSPTFLLGRFLSEQLTMTDTIIRQAGKVLSQTITFSDTFAKVQLKFYTETITMSDTFNKLQGKILSEVMSLLDILLLNFDGEDWYAKTRAKFMTKNINNWLTKIRNPWQNPD